MKKLTKILLAAGGAALICGGSIMTYLKAQTPQLEVSDLTLQNLEAMAKKTTILDDNQVGVFPDCHNNPFGRGCTGRTGMCEIRN
ncbi:hypothetical protein [uncultured Rikenella sp.]|uniref:hypothetical protein n=1 Tax=uncultured Rikenella sp. TaxID=368003 RepID=UPI0025D43839|nr:hypothetical protein [uncultured Rikenella sp.]